MLASDSLGKKTMPFQQHLINYSDRITHPRPWFDSAPGHQETPKPPAGGFLLGVFLVNESSPLQAR